MNHPKHTMKAQTHYAAMFKHVMKQKVLPPPPVPAEKKRKLMGNNNMIKEKVKELYSSYG